MAKLQVGEKFPDLLFHTAFSGDLYTKELLKGKTAFWFLRYAGCTLCRYDLYLAKKASEFYRERGWSMVFVLQSDKEHVLVDYKEEIPPFEIVCDPDQELYRSLDIIPAVSFEDLFKEQKEAADAKLEKALAEGFVHGDPEGEELQLPAVFVIGEDQTVFYAHYARTIVDMPEIGSLPDFFEKVIR